MALLIQANGRRSHFLGKANFIRRSGNDDHRARRQANRQRRNVRKRNADGRHGARAGPYITNIELQRVLLDIRAA